MFWYLKEMKVGLVWDGEGGREGEREREREDRMRRHRIEIGREKIRT